MIHLLQLLLQMRQTGSAALGLGTTQLQMTSGLKPVWLGLQIHQQLPPLQPRGLTLPAKCMDDTSQLIQATTAMIMEKVSKHMMLQQHIEGGISLAAARYLRFIWVTSGLGLLNACQRLDYPQATAPCRCQMLLTVPVHYSNHVGNVGELSLHTTYMIQSTITPHHGRRLASDAD